MPDTSTLDTLYQALTAADREAVDVRRGLGEGLQAALVGAGLLLPLPATGPITQARQAVAEQLGVRLVVVDDQHVTVDPPSRGACAVIAAVAGEWAYLDGGHLIPGDWRALLAATSADPSRLLAVRNYALALLLARRAEITAATSTTAAAACRGKQGRHE
ncbi:hypothetical protein PYK79_23175 [Streptomyces sp. ID05-04B]|uniref:hypothetical protein n=1 Tax=Streptomyces sp. ID05-04B TaxID=3028661 RepID=UPI0029C40813|nr:hypothetical protein [Streptomyces sp. ID05-04B]MDX5565645.1 hypothetical protein [Streptomyces sp. ID05-04B]